MGSVILIVSAVWYFRLSSFKSLMIFVSFACPEPANGGSKGAFVIQKFYSSATELVPKENKHGYGFSGYAFPDLDEMMKQECKDDEFNGLQEKYDRNKDSRAYLNKAYPRPAAARATY